MENDGKSWEPWVVQVECFFFTESSIRSDFLWCYSTSQGARQPLMKELPFQRNSWNKVVTRLWVERSTAITIFLWKT